ncbi:DUF1987 domain-containing protein [Fulvivirga kasyanovii]|uniref:DUF1987 domain-containing protein n=1 Tax=Fulvivirga kasyanovii TaxID=396812 RepID=A0ABW9RS67_9BACT|nr:DUF1987 domain-containing protein [Fulvivirga kasyanovii]MTI25910.1 DUF1987 domain-containing protein [Fulvivirga kasyanovii]
MDNYTLVPTPKTPRLYFNAQNGDFEISGRSIPENSIEFYKPLLEWLDEYEKKPQPETKLHVNLEYFNTSSSKCLVEILRKLEKVNEKTNVKVFWHYEEEDEDMMESGEDFKKILKLPIELVVVKGGG